MPSALTYKIGGVIPAWVLGAIIGAGILGYGYLRHKNAADTSSGDTTAVDQNGTPLDTSGVAGDSTLDTSAPLDLSGTYGGAAGGFNYAPWPAAPPASQRIDPEQYKRLQKELQQIRNAQKRDAQRDRRNKKKPDRKHPAQAGHPR